MKYFFHFQQHSPKGMSLELAKERICQLEDAIRRLDSVQIHLTKNASEVSGDLV